MASMSDVLVDLLDDLDFRARQTAVSLLSSVGDRTAIAALESFRRQETVASLSKSALDAIKNIRTREESVEEVAGENQREAQMKDLETRIEELEAKVESWNAKN